MWAARIRVAQCLGPDPAARTPYMVRPKYPTPPMVKISCDFAPLIDPRTTRLHFATMFNTLLDVPEQRSFPNAMGAVLNQYKLANR